MKIRWRPLLLLSLVLVLPLSCSRKKTDTKEIPKPAVEQPATDKVVPSRIMNHVEYNPSSLELFVYYNNGDRLGFKGVPKAVYRELITAGSRDTFFEGKIKGVYAEFTPPPRKEHEERPEAR